MTYKARQAMYDAANAPGVTTTCIVLAVILSASLLTYFDKLGGDAYAGLVSAILGGVLVRAGVASGSAAKDDPPATD